MTIRIRTRMCVRHDLNNESNNDRSLSNRMKELNQNIENTEGRITFEINNVKATAMKMQPKVLVQREF